MGLGEVDTDIEETDILVYESVLCIGHPSIYDQEIINFLCKKVSDYSHEESVLT